MSNSSTFSVVGPDVTIKGDLSASADLHVDGRIEGDLVCASLVQGESSMIMGSIEAETARLAGQVTGSIAVRELVILKSARIEGDVHYDSLTIEQGAEVDGQLAHRATGSKAAMPPIQSQKPAAKEDPGKAGEASDDELRLSLAG